MVQSINIPGVLALGQVLRRPHLLLPHISTQHIGVLDFRALKRGGIRGIVFDKDNTLTAPYVDSAYETVATSFEECKSVFGPRSVVILSNSAGTLDDPGYEAAKRIESTLGVHVVRHKTKKPGRIPEVLQYYQSLCGLSDRPVEAHELCVIGDRLMTDVLWGNIHGMLTVHTQVLTTQGDNKAARVVRRLELGALKVMRSTGVTAPNAHPCLPPDATWSPPGTGASTKTASEKGDQSGASYSSPPLAAPRLSRPGAPLCHHE